MVHANPATAEGGLTPATRDPSAWGNRAEVGRATKYQEEKGVTNLLYIANYNLAKGQGKAFQQFIRENQTTIAENAPKGWTYRGTYFYVSGFGPYTCADIWEITDYGDLDAFRDHDDPVWLELSQRGFEYGTAEPTQAWLLRAAGDTKITEPELSK